MNIKINLVDTFNKSIYPASVTIAEGKIQSIQPIEESEITTKGYLMPGFIDSHVHI